MTCLPAELSHSLDSVLKDPLHCPLISLPSQLLDLCPQICQAYDSHMQVSPVSHILSFDSAFHNPAFTGQAMFIIKLYTVKYVCK